MLENGALCARCAVSEPPFRRRSVRLYSQKGLAGCNSAWIGGDRWRTLTVVGSSVRMSDVLDRRNTMIGCPGN